jgi:dTDP-4-dehydrorhamnose reductase
VKIAVTGLSGVIGQILAEEISLDTEIIDLYHQVKYAGSAKITKHVHLDLLNQSKIASTLDQVKPDIVIHMAAITHIDRCEMDKVNGIDGIVWKVNVEGTREIAKFCAQDKVPLVYLSTECIFDGVKKYFSENSKRNPINWYGFTKNEAEKLLIVSNVPVAIVRAVVAYHENDNNRTIYGKILEQLKSQKTIEAVDDQLFTPTYTYDIVYAILQIVKHKLVGTYHIAPQKALSPYEFAVLIAKKNNYSSSKIKKTTLTKYYDKEKAGLRLRHACLLGKETNKILKFVPKNPEEVLCKAS